MRVSEIREADVITYLRLDEVEEQEITPYLEAAVHFVESSTGLPVTNEGECLDKHPDITIAVMALCQDMYDNRSVQIEKNSLNQTIESILCMYSQNIG